MKMLVIGACNIDLIGISKNELIPHESNIGEIRIALGGVAKNIATDLFYLGADVAFVTLIGEDYFAGLQKKELEELGIEFSRSFFKKTLSSTYLAVHDHDGDMSVAINDMRAFEKLTAKDFEEIEAYIETFDILVMDTNLNQTALEYLIRRFSEKIIYVDGVSQTKVSRIKNVLQHIDLLKLNKYELNSLLEATNCDIIQGVKRLNGLGLKNCLVSSANEPITYNIDTNIYQSITHKNSNIRSTMGAGDALFAGVIYALTRNKNMHEAVNFGKIVASKTLEVYEASNKEIKELIDF